MVTANRLALLQQMSTIYCVGMFRIIAGRAMPVLIFKLFLQSINRLLVSATLKASTITSRGTHCSRLHTGQILSNQIKSEKLICSDYREHDWEKCQTTENVLRSALFPRNLLISNFK